MTAAQIAARATSDELQRRLLETPIAAATERTLLVNEGRTMGREFPLPAETRVFVVANQKGGVGKTTTTVNVAAGLALYGARILVIDLDPQGNASTALGIDHTEGTPGVYEAIIEGESLGKLLAPCAEHPGIMVVPATIDLAGAEIELVSIVARESRLKKALDAHLAETEAAGEKYDYVFIDCPPSLGLLTVNALTAAREVLVPIQSEYYALEGLSQLLRHIDMVKSHLNPGLDVSTILLTMYDARTKLAGEVAAEVRGHFQEPVLRTAVPRSVRISEAPSHGQTVLAYDPASAGALSYLEASREIAMRNNAVTKTARDQDSRSCPEPVCRPAGTEPLKGASMNTRLGRGLGALIPSTPGLAGITTLGSKSSSIPGAPPERPGAGRRTGCRVRRDRRRQDQPEPEAAAERLRRGRDGGAGPLGQGDRPAAADRGPDDCTDDTYELVMGERRWRATQLAGLDHDPGDRP